MGAAAAPTSGFKVCATTIRAGRRKASRWRLLQHLLGKNLYGRPQQLHTDESNEFTFLLGLQEEGACRLITNNWQPTKK
jgi:hypothetical protein